MEKRIGVFDSGLGGLTVLKELIELMPEENYYVYGDTKNMPYGVRQEEDIRELTVDGYKKLTAMGIKALVIACNTATVHGLKAIQEITDIPVIGVIEPGVMSATECGCEKVLILATEATIKSGLIQRLLKEKNPSVEVEGIGAPEMVLAVENGQANTEEGRQIVYKYLDTKSIKPTCVMLSCTHFPALEHFIVDYFKEKGKEIKTINPARKCAELLQIELDKRGTLNKSEEKGNIEYFTSGDLENYKEIGNSILGKELIKEVKSIWLVYWKRVNYLKVSLEMK